jgi:hypothetical protein
VRDLRWRVATLDHGGSAVIRWNVRLMRAAIALAAFVVVAIGSGAGARWS